MTVLKHRLKNPGQFQNSFPISLIQSGIHFANLELHFRELSSFLLWRCHLLTGVIHVHSVFHINLKKKQTPLAIISTM